MAGCGKKGFFPLIFEVDEWGIVRGEGQDIIPENEISAN